MDVMLEIPEGCITTNFMHISFDNNRMELPYLLSSHHVPAQITTWSPTVSAGQQPLTEQSIWRIRVVMCQITSSENVWWKKFN